MLDTAYEQVKELGLIHETAEWCVVGGLLYGDENTQVAEKLQVDSITDPKLALVAEAYVSLLKGFEPIDDRAILSACKRINDTRPYKQRQFIDPTLLEAIGHTENKGNALGYTATLAKLSYLREFTGVAQWVVEQSILNADPDTLFAGIQERLKVMSPETEDGRMLAGADTVRTHKTILRERRAARAAGVVSPFTWPWASWNENIRPHRGGIVGTIVAPDGMGKSTVLDMVAEQWAKNGQNILYVHLEDDHQYKLDRRLCRQSKVPLANIEDGDLDAHDAAISAAHAEISIYSPRLHYLHMPNADMGQVERRVRQYHERGLCDAVVMDYHDKLGWTRGQQQLYRTNLYSKQADDSERIKNLAEDLVIPWIQAKQGNKSLQNGGTQTRQNLRGSGEISEKSQLVIVITRDIVEGILQDKNGGIIAQDGDYSPYMTVRVDKQNRGRPCSFQQWFNGPTYTIRDLG